MTSTTTNPDWPEDFHLENGSYNNQCMDCKRVFMGLKGRLQCKPCWEVAVALQETLKTELISNPAKFIKNFFVSEKLGNIQRAEAAYVARLEGTPMNRKQRREQGRKVPKPVNSARKIGGRKK